MSNKTVIVADDTAFVRDRFATALVGAGHKALTVKSAAELLAHIRADLAEIDLLVLDLRLPHAPPKPQIVGAVEAQELRHQRGIAG